MVRRSAPRPHRDGHVITIDINPVQPIKDTNVTALHGDATNPATFEQARELIAGRTCMIVEDSAHTYSHTTAVLQMYANLVTRRQWFVVEDGVVDIEELRLPGWPRGVTPAINEFLDTPTGQQFTRHFMEQYILTCHPGGWLQRTAPAAPA